jgi:mono/diheme cytochrome c family protein
MKIMSGTALAGAMAGVVFVGLVAAVVGVAFVASGRYNVSANKQHLQPVYQLLQTAMHYSVKRYAADIEAPPLDDERRRQGLALYLDNCLQCHGAPGVAPDPFTGSLQPVPGPLVDATQRWLPRDLYWITRNGVKMSGMPAWEYRLSDDELWAVVAFLDQMPNLSVPEFDALAQAVRPGYREARARADDDDEARPRSMAASQEPTADPRRGLTALHQHGCHACHVIPGVTGSDVHVGPPLAGIASRQLIAGSAPNNPEQMVRWLRDPKSIDPWTAMPDLGVGERAARDMAAYLATLH